MTTPMQAGSRYAGLTEFECLMMDLRPMLGAIGETPDGTDWRVPLGGVHNFLGLSQLPDHPEPMAGEMARLSLQVDVRVSDLIGALQVYGLLHRSDRDNPVAARQRVLDYYMKIERGEVAVAHSPIQSAAVQYVIATLLLLALDCPVQVPS